MNDFQDMLRETLGFEKRDLVNEAKIQADRESKLVRRQKKRSLLERDEYEPAEPRYKATTDPAGPAIAVDKDEITPAVKWRKGQEELANRAKAADPKEMFLQFLTQFGEVVERYKKEFDVEMQAAEKQVSVYTNPRFPYQNTAVHGLPGSYRVQ